MKKRIVSLLLAVCLAASLLTVPVGAKSVSFADIPDRDTIVAVESLRLMGVLDGFADGTFRPDSSLTRAQFCKMAVYAMNGSAELGRYSMVTVFPDVKPSHWASSYINMAAKGKGIIAGFADGRFHPESTVTVGQAVTILVRLLGYTDEDVGGIWPQGHMATAASIGLTDGVSTSGYAALTRGQAARLFLNLLRMEKKDGGRYAGDVGALVEGQMLVSSSVPAPDGTNTALQTAEGVTYQLSGGKASNGALNGQKGTLLLDKGGKVLTFIPDSTGSSKTAIVSETEAGLLKLTDGSVYAMTGSVELFLNNEQTTWGAGFALVTSGSSVTLYLNAAGAVEYVFVGSGAVADKAVIVYENQSTAGFDALTGGISGYQIYKNGVSASAADLRKYDVATYSAATNSIRVSNTRISGYYENCTPNPAAPETVTVMGHAFQVLPSATESVAQFKPGQQVTFLLTEDNQIAGAVKPGSVSTTLVGVARSVSDSSATVELLCGVTVSGKVSLSASEAAKMNGQLVKVSSAKSGLSLTRLASVASGDLDVAAGTVGNREMAENVRIFEKTPEGLKAIGLGQLGVSVVPKKEIAHMGTDWAGRVDLLVIGGANSSGTVYGRAVVTKTEMDGEEHRTMAVQYGDGKSVGPFELLYDVSDGDYVKATLNEGGTRFSGVTELTALKNVPASAWIGTGAVTVSARTYTVPEDLACYNSTTRTWMTLAAARAYADTMTLYVEGGTVRGAEIR